jgi:hypothetical protein
MACAAHMLPAAGGRRRRIDSTERRGARSGQIRYI